MHEFVLLILPKEIESVDAKEGVEAGIHRIMDPYRITEGEENKRGFYDYFGVGGAWDGAINGLSNYYREALALSENNPRKDYGPLLRWLATEELKRNSRRVDQVTFPTAVQKAVPNRIVLPDGSVIQRSGESWDEVWPELAKRYGRNLCVGLDCHA